MEPLDYLNLEAEVFVEHLNAIRCTGSSDRSAAHATKVEPTPAGHLVRRLRALRYEKALLQSELGLQVAELTHQLEAARASSAWRLAHWLRTVKSYLVQRIRRWPPAAHGDGQY